MHLNKNIVSELVNWLYSKGYIFGWLLSNYPGFCWMVIFQLAPRIWITLQWYTWSTQLELRIIFVYILYALGLNSSTYVLSTLDSYSS